MTMLEQILGGCFLLYSLLLSVQYILSSISFYLILIIDSVYFLCSPLVFLPWVTNFMCNTDLVVSGIDREGARPPYLRNLICTVIYLFAGKVNFAVDTHLLLMIICIHPVWNWINLKPLRKLFHFSKQVKSPVKEGSRIVCFSHTIKNRIYLVLKVFVAVYALWVKWNWNFWLFLACTSMWINFLYSYFGITH